MPELFPKLESPFIVAHRGGTTGVRNTLDAFRNLINSGGEAVEFDVRRTIDGVLVVHHGANVSGLRLDRLTYDEFCHFSKQRPATLEDALELCGQRLHINCEIKTPGYEAEVLERLSRQMDKWQYMVSSYNSVVVSRCKKVDPEVTTGLIVVASARPVIFPVARALHSQADVLVLNHLIAPPMLARRAADKGLKVVLWTVNTPRGLAHAFSDTNISGVITDYPHRAERIRRAVREQGNPGIGERELDRSQVLN